MSSPSKSWLVEASSRAMVVALCSFCVQKLSLKTRFPWRSRASGVDDFSVEVGENGRIRTSGKLCAREIVLIVLRLEDMKSIPFNVSEVGSGTYGLLINAVARHSIKMVTRWCPDVTITTNHCHVLGSPRRRWETSAGSNESSCAWSNRRLRHILDVCAGSRTVEGPCRTCMMVGS